MSKQIRLQINTYNKWCSCKSSEGFEEKSHNDFAEYLISQMHNAETSENEIIDVCGITQDSIKSNENTDNLNVINSSLGIEVNTSLGNESTLTTIEFSPTKRSKTDVVLTPEAVRFRPADSEDSLKSASGSKANLLSTPQVNKIKCLRSINEPNSLSFSEISVNNEDTTFFKEHTEIEVQEDEYSDDDDPFTDVLISESESDDSSDDSSSDGEMSSEENENDDDDDLVILGDTSDMHLLGNVIDQMKGTNTSASVDFNIDTIREKYVLQDEVEVSNNVTFNSNKSVDMSLCSNINTGDTLIDASIAANLDEVKEKLQTCFDTCYQNDPVDKELQFVGKERIIVSIDKLKELKGEQCQYKYTNGEICCSKISFEVSGRGSCRQLKWKCTSNHTGKWYSSEILTTRHTTPIFVNDLLITSCVLLSGNNWSKIELMCNFMNLNIPVGRVFSRNQNFYVAPEVRSLWCLMKENVSSVLNQYSEICLCGDGRNDSPGHCARFCTYILMEHFAKVIVDLEIMDSRESHGISTNMERDALIRLLLRLRHTMEINELTSDASTSIIKSVRDMAKIYASLTNIEHSLDIWHKAKSLRKALHKIVKEKKAEITPWIDSIINHFWHCSQNCENDLEKLKDMWVGVLHHVCGEHYWAGSQCSHGESTKEDPKTPLLKTSNSMDALRSVILDPRFMNSLQYYTRFRHTSDLENFNSMLLKYASKRVAFEYEYYGVRMMLAAMDHNIHLFRSNATTKSGEQLFKRQYCKRVKHWHAEPVKKPKKYPHIPYLLANIFKRRINDMESVDRHFSKLDNDPKLISPTISGNKPPSTASLIADNISRLKKL